VNRGGKKKRRGKFLKSTKKCCSERKEWGKELVRFEPQKKKREEGGTREGVMPENVIDKNPKSEENKREAR